MMLSKELGTKLTGRYIPVTMYPYSFYEYTNFNAPELINKKVFTTSDKGKAKNLFSNYCRVGGIPEYVRLEQTEYLHTLYEGIIYRDIITRYKLPQEKPIKELTFYLASNIGKEVTFNALRKIINVSSATTVAEYCSYLENCYLSFLVNYYSHSLKKQITYGKKQYFIDHALANAIGFRTSEDRGRVLENIVFIELKRRYNEIYFHQEKNECDFIVKSGNKVDIAIQVCANLDSEQTKKREYSGLIEAMKLYHLNKGIILTVDFESQEKITDDKRDYTILIIPLWKWLLDI